jgi:hypothetical protein
MFSALGVPRTAEEVAELEARYRPFAPAAGWRGVRVDLPRWERFAHQVAKRRVAADEELAADTMDRVLRAAALDSAALDGLFPANPELTALVLGGSVVEETAADDPAAILVECSRRGLVLASESAASGRAVDQHLIAVLQDVVTEAQASYTVSTDQGEVVEVDLPRRQYKPVSNYLPLAGGGLAAFAPARLVAAEMERLAGELASADFAALHPVVRAAYAHYALTAIHPFADGNGRLARTVASVYLLRAVGVPLVVFAEQWPAYYQALHLATQEDDWQALADFCCAAAMSAMDLAANLLARPAEEALAAEVLGSLGARRADAEAAVQAGDVATDPAGKGATDSAGHVAGDGADDRTGHVAGVGTGDQASVAAADRVGDPAGDRALDEGACALVETVAVELREALVAPRRGVRVALTTSRTLPACHAEGAYRFAAGSVVVRLAVRVAGLDGAGGDLEFVPLVSLRDGDLLPVAVRETHSGELLEVALDDVYPLVNESAMVRARVWAQRLAATVLANTALATAALAAAAATDGVAL